MAATPGYAFREFVDPTHMNRRGAEVISADLGRLIANRLGDAPARERWAALPRFHVRDTKVPMMDVSQIWVMVDPEMAKQLSR